MENMLCLQSKKYILPKSIRQSYKVFGLISLIGLLGFVIFMIAVGSTQETDKAPCFAVAAIFGMVLVWYTIIWIKNYSLIHATYYIDDAVVINGTNKLGVKVSVDLASARTIDYTQSFYVGKGSFQVEYTIFLKEPTSSTVFALDETNIYKALRAIWISGSAIVPKLEDGSLS